MKPIQQHIIIVILAVTAIITSCKSRQLSESEAREAQQKLQQIVDLDTLRVDVYTAYPFQTAATQRVMNSIMLRNTGNNSARVNVSGDGNFVEIKKDSAKGFLLFYGERRNNSGTYGGRDSAIEFDGLMTDFEKNTIEDTGKLEIKFTIPHVTQDTDMFDVKLTIFPNDNVTVDVTPTFRTYMRYDGRLVESKE